jgi:hypothetical protein
MKSHPILLATILTIGCASSDNTKQPGNAAETASSASIPSIRQRTNADPSFATPQKKLDEGEVRMALLVLPGDALVEVDKVPVRRRNGLIELLGKVGEERRVEVFWGANAKVEHVLKIEAPGGALQLIDAEEETKLKIGPAKGPAVFNNDE